MSAIRQSESGIDSPEHIARVEANRRRRAAEADEYERRKAAATIPGRMAACTNCGKVQPSNPYLAFFVARPSSNTDAFYCGCRGWN